MDASELAHSIQQGSGAPVVMIHGLAASVHDWIDLTPALVTAGYGVYALDLLGHGKSVKPKDLQQYQIDKVFEHLDSWIESLHLDAPMILISHSLGGYLSIEYALRHPEKVRALVLIDPFYSLDQLSLLLRLHYKRPVINLGLISYAPKWMIRLSIEMATLFIRNGYIAPQSKSGRAQTADDYKNASPGIYNILSTTRDLTPVLPQMAAPALVICGAHDQSLAPESFKKLADAMPNARIIVMNSGHVPHQSHTQEFNKHVLAFLGTVVDGSLGFT